jgi:hypothetical protein
LIARYIFFLNLEVIQLKLLKDLAQISLSAYGDYLLGTYAQGYNNEGVDEMILTLFPTITLLLRIVVAGFSTRSFKT